MKLPLTGGSYKHPSIDVNYQRCVNMYPVTAGPEGRGENALIPTRGLLLLTTLGIGPIRCMITVGEFVYVVSANTVYKLTINYLTKVVTTTTTIGTLTTSSGTVYAAANPTQIIFVDGTASGYILTISSEAWAVIADGDFTAAGQVKFLDGYFLYNQVSTGKIWNSALNNGTSWAATDVLTASSSTDNVLALGKSKGELWVFGEDTTEIFYDAANASGSPLSVRTGLGMQIGCGAAASVVEIDDLLVWMDNRGYIVQSSVSPFIRSNNSGYTLKIISDDAVTAEFLSYRVRDDAIACTYNDRGHLMYQITFPTVKKTWVYDYNSKMWHERSYYNSFTDSDEAHLGQYYTQFHSLHLMGGQASGMIYLSSELYYDDNGVDIRRIRTTPVQFEPTEHKMVVIDRLELRMGSGDAAQGVTPYVSMRYSHNGGHTWSSEMNRSFGATGEYGKLIDWNRLGGGFEWLFEFSVVTPTKFSIIEAVISSSNIISTPAA